MTKTRTLTITTTAMLAGLLLYGCGGKVVGDQQVIGAGGSGHDASAGGAGGSGATAGTGGTGGVGGTGGQDGVAYGIPGQSCSGGLDCGGVSCCQNIVVPGGTFPMGCVPPANPNYETGEQPEHNATVASFALETYEVTVGRFRKFVQAYNGVPPPDGAAAHPLIAGTGWQSAWNASLPTSQAALIANVKCDATYQTWTDAVGGNETYSINCVDWYEAFAFCAWDGGRLPTEAEWEYASAGGDEDRLYPWGSEDPSVNKALANDYYSDNSPFINVGSHPLGAARWGHKDLAGGMSEWAFDMWNSLWYTEPCNNCANVDFGVYRVIRDGGWVGPWGPYANHLRAASRTYSSPTGHGNNLGFRCARTP